MGSRGKLAKGEKRKEAKGIRGRSKGEKEGRNMGSRGK